jgi:hypothetical protein
VEKEREEIKKRSELGIPVKFCLREKKTEVNMAKINICQI